MEEERPDADTRRRRSLAVIAALVTASATLSIVGVRFLIQGAPPAENRLEMEAPPSTRAGAPFAVNVTVRAADGQVLGGYRGTVRFTSSDDAPTLPPDHAFLPGDFGAYEASDLVLRTEGVQTVSVTDIADASLAAQASIGVLPFPTAGPRVGEEAPEFVVSGVGGDMIRLREHHGAATVLHLMDADCGACQAEAPVLAAVYGDYEPRGVRFLSVSLIDWAAPADTRERLEAFKTQYGTPWAYGMDVSRDVRNTYLPGGLGGVPTTYILDRNGVIIAIFRGSAPGGALDYANALDPLVGG